MWNDTEPTSTVFTVGDDGGTNGNAAAYDYVAYVFAHDDSDESMIKCGSFTGNPTTIDLGFEPQWMIAKKYDSTSSWQMFDAMRGWTADGGTVDLVADTDSSESDRLSRDYTQLKSDGVTFNGYGGSWIYMAIRRPNKPAEEFDPEELFGILDSIPANSGANNTVIPTDNEFDVIMGNPDYVRGNSMNMSSRHQGGKAVWTNSDRAEFTSPQFYLDYMKAFRQSIANGTDFLACTFKRQPGFFDVVAHTCDGDQGSLYPHNLGVVPDMVWRKERNNSSDWQVWVRAMPNNNDGADGGIYLNTDGQYYNGNTQWGWLTPPTDTHLSNGVFRTAGRDIVSYLFASVPGICDIGTFTGLGPNGNIVEVDCGFTNGARFVLVKRVDGTGNWMFWDSARGVSSTLSLNKTDAAGYENRYYQWPKGFKVNSYDLDGEEWNPGIDGAEYIYMAIA
jgi:hypothetical protein